MLMAFNTWLILQASLETSLSAGLWNAGSLNKPDLGENFPVGPLYFADVYRQHCFPAVCDCWRWGMTALVLLG